MRRLTGPAAHGNRMITDIGYHASQNLCLDYLVADLRESVLHIARLVLIVKIGFHLRIRKLAAKPRSIPGKKRDDDE